MEIRKPPFFSIISVALNNRGGLEQTWASVLAQSCMDYEWIAVDGGSTDGTKEFLKNFVHVSEPDRGIFDAMNKGIERANGEYILFLNAGDVLAAAGTLQRIYDSVVGQNARPDFIYGDAIEGGFYKRARAPGKRGMFTHHQSMIYARQKIGAMRYDLNYKIAGDYDFTQRFLNHAKNVLYCSFAFCIFETGGVSQTQAARGRKEEFMIRRQTGMNSFKNGAIYVQQTLAWNLRRLMPGLYWRIKSSGNNQSASLQT